MAALSYCNRQDIAVVLISLIYVCCDLEKPIWALNETKPSHIRSPEVQFPPHSQGYEQQQYSDNKKIQNSATDDHHTFLYKGRRYSYVNAYPKNERVLRPGSTYTKGQDERFLYDSVGEPIRWRPDLQGKIRDQTIDKHHSVYVETTHGNVQGFMVYLFDDPSPDSLYRPGAEFVESDIWPTEVFLGIPYAEPPVNEGRFKPPRWHKGWQLLQATDFGPACPQPARFTGATLGIRDTHEDCLYLNIYKPKDNGVGELFPVMVYIHGGNFISGASNEFPGHVLATFYKVVVVTLNYRLGALGFISTGDVNSPGNYGILDMAMALRWIYENIVNFRGDKDGITLFGPGAGASAAGLLMVAPETKHIVSKVIAQSGSALADWALITDIYRMQNTSRAFGNAIGCSIESSWKLMNCLRHGRSFVEIGNAEFPPEIGMFPWAPVIDVNVSMPYYEGWYEKDWHFLRETPEELIRQRHFHPNLKYMASVTLQEGVQFITSNKSLAPQFKIDQAFVDQKMQELVLRYNYTLNMNGTFEAIKFMYTYWPDRQNPYQIRDKYTQLLTDFLYTAPNDKIIKMLVKQNVDVYMYVLNTTIESFHLEEWRKVPHNIEHYLLCGAPFMDVEFFQNRFRRDQWTNNDRNMSHFFMQAYANFAKYGDPTYTEILGLHFEPMVHGQLKYLNLNTTFNSSIQWNFRQTESAFWTEYLPTVIGHMYPTYPPTTEFWWEPTATLQIAFWSISGTCLLLVVVLVVCCMLWVNAKRHTDRYGADLFMTPVDMEVFDAVENSRGPSAHSDYVNKPFSGTSLPIHINNHPAFGTGTTIYAKETQGLVNSGNYTNKRDTKLVGTYSSNEINNETTPINKDVVPQTDV